MLIENSEYILKSSLTIQKIMCYSSTLNLLGSNIIEAVVAECDISTGFEAISLL